MTMMRGGDVKKKNSVQGYDFLAVGFLLEAYYG